MKFIITLLLLTSWSSYTQSISNIEGIKIEAPCELTYTRNLNNQNNYSCIQETQGGYIKNYSVTVANLYNDLRGLSIETVETYKEEFFKKTLEVAANNGEQSSLIFLKNNIRAISIVSKLTYGNMEFINTEIIFIYKKKSFIVNLTTNNLNKNDHSLELINSILFN